MKLTKVEIFPFRSINTDQIVDIEPDITVLVGMNEAGKTVFLRALEKSLDVLGGAQFDPVYDYPRRDLSKYMRKHATNPDKTTQLTYQLDSADTELIASKLKFRMPDNFNFSITNYFNNKSTVALSVDESTVVEALSNDTRISGDTAALVKSSPTIKGIVAALQGKSLTTEDQTFLAEITARVAAAGDTWGSVLSFEIWSLLSGRRPKFLYFGDYQILPGKMNLADLAARVVEAKTNPAVLSNEHKGILALLRMADVKVEDFTGTDGFETQKAKIESVSISITDQIMEFWKQNENLEVEVAISQDATDIAPFNNGPNLYLRIKNLRHRGISTSFDQRSKGFIWFFSFLVWFDSVQQQLAKGSATQKLVLLLDEPALSLHALAQGDFLNYIDMLGTEHQVIYTTHSPFMVHMDRLNKVRVVEDKDEVGTIISSNLQGSNPRTLFPLQAALGWTLAQSLFISERNLIVEGPSELTYLLSISASLQAAGRIGLRDDITIVPAGGLDKVVTFIALLGASGLKLAVLHDFKGSPEQKLVELTRHKLISERRILNASQFRDLENIGKNGRPSDIEDLFTVEEYLEYFSGTFAKAFSGKTLVESNLPAGDRIVTRLEGVLLSSGIELRPSGGFNHYLVSNHFAANPPAKIDETTLKRFEALFKTINELF